MASDSVRFTSKTLVGRWHLVDADSPRGSLPAHRAVFVFREIDGSLQGAIISHPDGQEVPLASVELTGGKLRLRLPAAGQHEEPVLIAVPASSRNSEMNAYWVVGEKVPIGAHALKLVRGIT